MRVRLRGSQGPGRVRVRGSRDQGSGRDTAVNGPEAVQGCYCGRWVPWLWFVDRGCKDCGSRIMRAGATARGSSGCQGCDPWIMWEPGLRFVDHVGRGYDLWIKRVPGLRSVDHEDLCGG